jgi:hypothetical protein
VPVRDTLAVDPVALRAFLTENGRTIRGIRRAAFRKRQQQLSNECKNEAAPEDTRPTWPARKNHM